MSDSCPKGFIELHIASLSEVNTCVNINMISNFTEVKENSENYQSGARCCVVTTSSRNNRLYVTENYEDVQRIISEAITNASPESIPQPFVVSVSESPLAISVQEINEEINSLPINVNKINEEINSLPINVKDISPLADLRVNVDSVPNPINVKNIN